MTSGLLPAGTIIALVVMVAVPVLTYVLYRIDKQRGDGSVTVLGRGGR